MQASQWTKQSPRALELLLARSSPTTHPQGRAWGGTGAWGGPTDMYCVLLNKGRLEARPEWKCLIFGISYIMFRFFVIWSETWKSSLWRTDGHTHTQFWQANPSIKNKFFHSGIRVLGMELSSKNRGETCRHHNGRNIPLGHLSYY